MSSLNCNSLCSASLVIRDKFLAKFSFVLSFKRFSLLLTSCLLRLISSHRFSLSTWTALSSSLILQDICSFCFPMLPTMLVKASSIDAPLSSTFVHDPLLDLQVGYIALCFCSSQFASPNSSWSQSLLEAVSRSEVILLVIVLLLFLGFCFIACTCSHGSWKKVSQRVLHSF